mmetsp:Transcript_101212/g.190659  ORF Transcript_101212/g.190659 Transcript_101212/m.190659 type:complete len:253 (+) Transcript_101212:336-1094(+)
MRTEVGSHAVTFKDEKQTLLVWSDGSSISTSPSAPTNFPIRASHSNAGCSFTAFFKTAVSGKRTRRPAACSGGAPTPLRPPPPSRPPRLPRESRPPGPPAPELRGAPSMPGSIPLRAATMRKSNMSGSPSSLVIWSGSFCSQLRNQARRSALPFVPAGTPMPSTSARNSLVFACGVASSSMMFSYRISAASARLSPAFLAMASHAVMKALWLQELKGPGMNSTLLTPSSVPPPESCIIMHVTLSFEFAAMAL